MAFDIKLKTSNAKTSYAGKANDIANINKTFEPYGIKVDEVKESAQIVRYILKLPLDTQLQGKISRAQKSIEKTLATALNTMDFSYKQTNEGLVIERKGQFNVVPFGNLYTVDFHKNTPDLAVVLGKDLDGNIVYTDINKAPHILIAGTTGSGKSETIHAIISSLLMKWLYGGKPLGIAIIDAKGSEFNKYKDAFPVTIINDCSKANDLLSNLCKVMDTRYKTMAQVGCDDISEYLSKGHEMYKIVVIIDELADLILQYPEVEKSIVRIAQKARGCGIHLVIGTQSPRANIVTGLIKANVPFKIALNTSNSMESRIILDETGAEKLFGKGDMLIKKGGNKAIHAQGCYVDDEDKAAINAAANANGKHFKFYEVVKPTPQKTPQAPTPQPQQQPKKRLGLFGTLKALYNAPEISGRIYYDE